ncbi:MAG: DASS family sodium-coupled anion symporter [Verrucomicrobia bacterium]|nr:DASS family sodium-coupled anion symporter [Verrucomicrobiota bacterium]MCH8511082.1 DASS family sodium-coupled anion symporter [Kiritimatiellia bacterium]
MMNPLKTLLKQPNFWKALLSLCFALGVYLLLPDSASEAARRACFIFVFAAAFWALEIIPLYATSMVVVLLNIFMLARPGGVLDMDDSGYQTFLVPFASPVIMLFFGGFVLATVMHKYELDRLIARHLVKLFGQNPFWVMVGMMLTTAFLSMWMSNTATAAMMIGLARPLCEQLDEDDPFRTGLVLSIPFSANIGGIATPVGTPPNAIAMGILSQHDIHLRFLDWMQMAVPLALVLLAAVAVVLHFMFRPKHKKVALTIQPGRKLDGRGKGVIVIALGTVILWLTSGQHGIPEALIGLLAAGLYASTNLLDKEDFKNLDWDVLILMWGGLALGRGMEVSGLSEWIVSLPIFEFEGVLLVAIASLVAIFMSTVMSNTATATLLIPIMIAIPTANPLVLAITVALACSFAMALPVSTPPNAIAFSSRMIRSQDMFRSGLLISFISWLILLPGYHYMLAWAFGFIE